MLHNLGNPNVETRATSSQALSRFGREGSTTIPKGSTLQANGSGSAEYPDKRDNDIVCSHKKLWAVLEDGLDIANPDEH